VSADVQRELEPSSEEQRPFSMRRPRRRDGMALGFGVAFVVFGVIGLVRALGVEMPTRWIYPVVFIGLGAAGLVSLFSRSEPREG